ncbi:MAG: tetraacyldisaccharide 4'-kinase [Methylotenera sp.]
MRQWLQKQWTTYTPWHLLLLPLAAIFSLLSSFRRYLYQFKLLKSYKLPVPVIVVGNINVGGTGKTPLVIWLAQQLIKAGYKPGIISRGYGGQVYEPMYVDKSADPRVVGDEPALIAMRTDCPVFVSADRVSAGQKLLEKFPACNVLISDDGLQHYSMRRDMEIVVYDANIGFGNGMLLPAGPLRETVARLKTVDAVVCNGEAQLKVVSQNYFLMQMHADIFYNLVQPLSTVDASAFSGKKVMAVAGIGNPQRFFNQLKQMGLQFQQCAFADHYAFTANDFADVDTDIVVMTEKDAVKCKAFASENFWVLPVNAEIENGLMPIILNRLNQ